MKNKVSYLLETIEKDLRSAVEGGERQGFRAGKLGAIPYRPLDQFIESFERGLS